MDETYFNQFLAVMNRRAALRPWLVEAEQLGFYVADVENLGCHYYHTLWWWDKNL